jgi:TonB family protein
MYPEDDLHFLLSDYIDRQTLIRRKGESLFFSLLFHLLLIVLILFGPLLHFPWSQKKEPPQPLNLTRLDSNRPVFLPFPKDRQKLKQAPPTPNLSDRDRLATRKTPMIDPRGNRPPQSEDKSIAVEQSASKGASPTEAAQAAPKPEAPGNPNQQAGLITDEGRMPGKMTPPEDLSPGGKKRMSLQDMMAKLETPGGSIQSSVDDAIRKGLFHGDSGSGGANGGIHKFDNPQANFSVDEPTILSDTRNIDFSAWLRIIYFRVRDNWYSAIPELIRTGTRGKTVLIFDVMKDGRVENLQVAKTSGIHPYDRAAMASINLSVPFPNFPPAFAGDRLTIQFSYFYNIRL